MVIADPAAELVRLITAAGDPPPVEASAADGRAAQLLRRRFGLALPPPFAGLPGDADPIRSASAVDGPAIACIKFRSFGATYRGLLDDAFLDGRGVAPPASFWVGRAMVPPSRRHALLVWGRPGSVFGYVDAGPAHPDDLPDADVDADEGAPPDPSGVGEVYELYLDPVARRRGGGARLLASAEERLAAAGFTDAQLWVLSGNDPARSFYLRQGWVDTGFVRHEDLGVVAFDEVRFVKSLR